MKQPPLRLLFVSHSFPPENRPEANLGGMQRVATELYEALDAHPGVAVAPLVLRTSWRSTHLRTPAFLARVAWELQRAARRHTADVVLFSSMVTATVAVPLRGVLQRGGLRSAAIVHGRDVTLPVAPYQHLVPRVFQALDAVLPVSRATGQACLVRGLDASRMHIVPNGVDARRFATGATRPEARQRLAGDRPLPEGALLLCSVGRQVERKGFAWFIRHVMPLLPPDVHYWLAGEGPETPRIQAAIAERNLQHRVRLLGRVSDEALALLYRASDLFVMPNVPVPGDMEGFGVVMLEAGLCGLPTIGADLEGIRDVITEGRNGHLLQSGDAGLFANVIRLYYHDRQEREAAAQRTAAHVATTFGWSSVADRYVRVLGQLARR